MKPPKVCINGVNLSEVRTRQLTDWPSNSITSVGRPQVEVHEAGSGLTIDLYPLTVAQLFFDGVLPQDRAIPIEVKVGRRKPTLWRIQTLAVRENRWREHVMVLSLEKA